MRIPNRASIFQYWMHQFFISSFFHIPGGGGGGRVSLECPLGHFFIMIEIGERMGIK